MPTNPRPTGRVGLLRIPGPELASLVLRGALLAARDRFDPASWPRYPFTASAAFPGWWELDLDALGLGDGVYEYELLANGATLTNDPYAAAITRFGGYRGLFTIVGGARIAPSFDWSDEFVPGISLPANNRIVIYEMPIKWMSSDPSEAPLVELGTIDKALFEHLDDLIALGINCIELLPIEDSPQTLNWGYGTRFFFAPDFDVASSVDLKFFIKACHRRGVRVILDVVMNMFAPECPLSVLAPTWFYTPSTASRQDWGQNLFLFDQPAYGSYFAAREFLCEMAEFWIADYHVDGFRIDDFADINNWDFVQGFRDRAATASATRFPGKPFLVVAEDSSGRFVATSDVSTNPNGRKVTDAIWNFRYRDEIRRLLCDQIATAWGAPSRSERVRHVLSKDGTWNDFTHGFDSGYADMACAVDYITSHDVADYNGQRLLNFLLAPMLQNAGLGDGSVANVRWAVDTADSSNNGAQRDLVSAALRRVGSAFALLMTSVGMPMFLAGEEFGDVHDTDFGDVNSKQQDPVQWNRQTLVGNAALKAVVGSFIRLRTAHPALQRNEIECFYFHPQFDDNNAPRVFAYCRGAGLPLGSPGQVIVIANLGAQAFPSYVVPDFRWTGELTELGYAQALPLYRALDGTLTLSLGAFEARVFTS
ncbi:MAG TPA: alpha-amylase family glycosyl hydrolase [Polyangiaceae bacterium]|nr:alpha-amylase family glycosyl hydrolase [Polyangiaceae bacterium]